jgi:hypothetical protein
MTLQRQALALIFPRYFRILILQFYPDAAVEFNIADKKQDYYCFNKDILSLNHDLYIHENINLEKQLFLPLRLSI